MTFAVLQVPQGRGAWSSIGGLLSVDGRSRGPYYRAPSDGSFARMPGATTAMAIRNNVTVDLNTYAVYMGVRACQRQIGVSDDGVWGPNTDIAAKKWQTQMTSALVGVADGVIGPRSTKGMFMPDVLRICGSDTNLRYAVVGHMGHESGWDPAAVGMTTPEDLGLGQINGVYHPDMSIAARLTPEQAIPWMVSFVHGNLEAMGSLDDGIAAYLLGIGGARSWVRAGRPQIFYKTDIPAYIRSVHTAAEA